MVPWVAWLGCFVEDILLGGWEKIKGRGGGKLNLEFLTGKQICYRNGKTNLLQENKLKGGMKGNLEFVTGKHLL